MPHLPFSEWIEIKDCDPVAFEIFSRHYSFRNYRDNRRKNRSNPNRKAFVGPGERIVLISPCDRALFVWKRCRDAEDLPKLFCSVFRNEGAGLSSDLILAAEKIAMLKWKPQHAFTFVNPRKIKSCNPGCCFRFAGWRRIGLTKGGLIILSKLLSLDK